MPDRYRSVWVPVGAFPPRTVEAGSSSLGLRLAGLGPGTYRLRATGAGTRVAAFTVR